MGRLASVPCLIELYPHAPSEDEVLAAIGKLIAFRQKGVRAARRRKRSESFVEPHLWIIAAGRPTTVLAELGAIADPSFPPGVYLAPGLLRAGIVVASELPRDRSTLLADLLVGVAVGLLVDDADHA